MSLFFDQTGYHCWSAEYGTIVKGKFRASVENYNRSAADFLCSMAEFTNTDRKIPAPYIGTTISSFYKYSKTDGAWTSDSPPSHLCYTLIVKESTAIVHKHLPLFKRTSVSIHQLPLARFSFYSSCCLQMSKRQFCI